MSYEAMSFEPAESASNMSDADEVGLWQGPLSASPDRETGPLGGGEEGLFQRLSGVSKGEEETPVPGTGYTMASRWQRWYLFRDP